MKNPTEAMDCPNGHGQMKLIKAVKEINFRDKELTIEAEIYRCPVCEIETGTLDQTAAIQKTISDEYRKKRIY